MKTARDDQIIRELLADLRARVAAATAGLAGTRPDVAEELNRQIAEIEAEWRRQVEAAGSAPDGALSDLLGLRENGVASMADFAYARDVDVFDDDVSSERIRAVADLYYIYQHEKVGVFRAIVKLRELFNAGAVRLSDGEGALGLYRFDRRQVLRYTLNDRLQAYRRVFGYTKAAPAPGARPNTAFHAQFVSFISSVAEFYRDRRVSEVVRSGAQADSFGSISVVRRAGLDLRTNIKGASYGHVNVLRLEVLQLLQETFRVLGQADIKNLYGADNAWDVVETVLERHLGERNVNTSQRSRMASAGRDILTYIGEAALRAADRAAFEAGLRRIEQPAEEWMTSAAALGLIPKPKPRAAPPGTERGGGRVAVKESELELESLLFE